MGRNFGRPCGSTVAFVPAFACVRRLRFFKEKPVNTREHPCDIIDRRMYFASNSLHIGSKFVYTWWR